LCCVYTFFSCFIILFNKWNSSNSTHRNNISDVGVSCVYRSYMIYL
jgi:hypothetical protein